MCQARCLACLALAVLCLVAQPVTADEIIDQINQAIELYQAGDFAGAAGELEFAAAQIRQLRAGEIAAALPEPLPGWTAEDAETAAMGAAMFGGGTSASRHYTKDVSSIDVNIVSDSPMIQSLAMLLNNPMMMSGSGQKLIRIKGNKAALEWEGDSGSINVLIMGSVLVTVEGYDVTEDDLVQYAEAVDYDLIKEIMSK
jgi:hypothetical protein